MIKYLCRTVDMTLVLCTDDQGHIQWWIDASYAVHPDLKGHTGATMSMGSGRTFPPCMTLALAWAKAFFRRIHLVHEL